MKNIILLHDAFAKPTQYWYSKLASIAPAGYSVITPELPEGTEQGMEYWMKTMEQYKKNITADTIIISHGIGSLLTVRLSETFIQPIRMYVSIAGCGETPIHQALAPIAETFLEKPIDWKTVATKLSSVIHIWNATDPFVSTELSKHFAELLPGKNVMLSGTEHFTELDEPELFSNLQTIFQEIEKTDTVKMITEKNQAEQQQKEDLAQSSIPSIVTYDTDVAQSVAGYQGKVISELLETARTKEKEKREVSVKNPKNILYIIGTVILILVGVGILGYEIQSKLPTTVNIVQSPNKKYATSLLRVESVVPFEVAGKKDFEIAEQFKQLQTTDVPEKTFESIVPINNGEKAPLQKFVDAFYMQFPVGFASITDDFVYGYYHPTGTDPVPFLLVHFNGYELMYSTMRNWEPDIVGETSPLFAPDQKRTTLVKTETPTFTDTIVNNIPMRTATLSTGKIITYGFLTDQTLLITTSPDVAEPLLRRMIGR